MDSYNLRDRSKRHRYLRRDRKHRRYHLSLRLPTNNTMNQFQILWHPGAYLAGVGNVNAVVGSASRIITSQIEIRPSIKIFVQGTMVSIAGPAHLAFASKSKNNLNQSYSTMIYEDRPIAVSTGVLASRVSVADRTIWAHASDRRTSLRGISDVASRARALIGAFGVHAMRITATARQSLATLVDVVTTLTLECVVDGRRHINALRVVAMVARRASFASKAGRQVRAANLQIAWLEQVALKRRENGSKINNAFGIWG